MGPCDFERIEGERVTFRAFDTLTCAGCFCTGRHAGLPRGMIIFAHEYSSDMYSCARYCRPLLAAGYDVFTFDFRGHGESSGEPGYHPRQWPSEREVNDMMGAIAYVEDWLKRHGRPIEMGVFGMSRGGGAAIVAASITPPSGPSSPTGAFSSDATLEHLTKRWAYIFAKVRFVYENHPPQFWKFLRWLLFRECMRKLRCTFPSVRKLGAGTPIVVGVEPSTIGSDRGLMRPMLENIRKCFDRLPGRHLADGGFAAADDIEWAHNEGVDIYCPPTKPKNGSDPFQPRANDGPGVLAWRGRMKSDEGKAQYRVRAICECIHARWRNWDLISLNVRGEAKLTAVVPWHALANNILQADRMLRSHRITSTA